MEKKTDFKALTRKQKFDYIWDYYRVKIIAVIICLAMAISLIHHYVTYKDSALTVIMINIDDPYAEETPGFDEFFEMEGFNSAKEIINADTSITFSQSDDAYSTDYYSDQKLTLLVAAGDTDIIFAPESIYTDYASAGSMYNLSTILTDEEMEQYADLLIYTTDSETGDTYPCGVKVASNNWASEYGYYSGEFCFGLICNTDTPEISHDFFNYVMNY